MSDEVTPKPWQHHYAISNGKVQVIISTPPWSRTPTLSVDFGGADIESTPITSTSTRLLMRAFTALAPDLVDREYAPPAP